MDHPGATPITTAQASCIQTDFSFLYTNWAKIKYLSHFMNQLDNFHLEQGEELKKMIGAAVYIECSSKTQQVSPTTTISR